MIDFLKIFAVFVLAFIAAFGFALVMLANAESVTAATVLVSEAIASLVVQEPPTVTTLEKSECCELPRYFELRDTIH